LSRRTATLLVGWSVVAGLAIALGAGSIDLAVYQRAAIDLVAGRDPSITPPGELPWLYPPIAAAVFIPLLMLPFPAASAVVALASLGALARTLHLVLGRLAPGRPDLVLLALAIAVATEPVSSTLGFGQVNLVLAWLVAEGFLGRRRWLIGVAAGLKLTPLVFMLPLVVRRDWRGAAQVAAGFAASVALGWVVAPAASAVYWSGLFLAGSSRVGSAYATNQSLTGAVARLFGEGGAPALTAALSAAVLAASVVVLRRFAADDVLALSVTGLAGLLVSPISWIHHWFWVLPLVLWLLSTGRRRLALAWGFDLLGRVTWWVGVGDGAEYAHGLPGKIAQDAWTLLALGTLALLATQRTRTAPRRPSESASRMVLTR